MNHHRLVSTLLGTLTTTAVLAALSSPPASARIVERGTFHDEFSFTDRDFCGAGLKVDVEGTVDGKYRITSRSPGGFDYYLENVTVGVLYTDRATGLSVTDIQPNTVGKDQSITDNGDGTVTLITLLTGGERTYGHEGNLIASNSGQVRFEVVFDAATGKELSSELIFGSTGTNDDFCAAVLADWGYA